jgi:hypothetical protein
MNCRKENYETFIIFKAQQWLEIETRAIDKRQRALGAQEPPPAHTPPPRNLW